MGFDGAKLAPSRPASGRSTTNVPPSWGPKNAHGFFLGPHWPWEKATSPSRILVPGAARLPRLVAPPSGGNAKNRRQNLQRNHNQRPSPSASRLSFYLAPQNDSFQRPQLLPLFSRFMFFLPPAKTWFRANIRGGDRPNPVFFGFFRLFSALRPLPPRLSSQRGSGPYGRPLRPPRNPFCPGAFIEQRKPQFPGPAPAPRRLRFVHLAAGSRRPFFTFFAGRQNRQGAGAVVWALTSWVKTAQFPRKQSKRSSSKAINRPILVLFLNRRGCPHPNRPVFFFFPSGGALTFLCLQKTPFRGGAQRCVPGKAPTGFCFNNTLNRRDSVLIIRSSALRNGVCVPGKPSGRPGVQPPLAARRTPKGTLTPPAGGQRQSPPKGSPSRIRPPTEGMNGTET